MEEVIKVEDCAKDIGDYDIAIHNAIIIPKDATNGDVIDATGLFEVVRNLSNDMRVCVSANGLIDLMFISFDRAWLNTPYRKV